MIISILTVLIYIAILAANACIEYVQLKNGEDTTDTFGLLNFTSFLLITGVVNSILISLAMGSLTKMFIPF